MRISGGFWPFGAKGRIFFAAKTGGIVMKPACDPADMAPGGMKVSAHGGGKKKGKKKTGKKRVKAMAKK
jgi:hypothetical protein